MSKWWHYWRRRGHVPKNRIESYLSLDCSWCYDKREYPLEEGKDIWIHGHCLKLFSSYALDSFQHNGETFQYKIPVVITKCNYGGERHWFLCPLSTCQRRSKKLYLHNQKAFLCRKCLNLAYTTQNRSAVDRIIDKKWRLIEKYGGSSEYSVQKPKGMHQKTFNRIRDEILRLDDLVIEKITLCASRCLSY